MAKLQLTKYHLDKSQKNFESESTMTLRILIFGKYFFKLIGKMSVWKNSLSTLLNNYQRPKHRIGSEVLSVILGKCKHIFKKGILRKELSRRSHSTKTRLSYQVSILELLSSGPVTPLPFVGSTVLWKHENLPFAHKATQLTS